ncbi:MAG: MarR family transcriptional regulator [Turicibacter sp.]|nr:MarR family transcriptional regulator [Turicibacter sp.]
MEKVIGKKLAIVYRYRQMILNHKLKPYHLGSGQYIVLISIADNEGINQRDLTHIIMIDKATTTKALKKLEEEGYIYRQCDEVDRRYNKLFLTEKGHQILPLLTSILVETMEELTIGMSEEEKVYFSSGLEKLLTNAVITVEHLRGGKL